MKKHEENEDDKYEYIDDSPIKRTRRTKNEYEPVTHNDAG